VHPKPPFALAALGAPGSAVGSLPMEPRKGRASHVRALEAIVRPRKATLRGRRTLSVLIGFGSRRVQARLASVRKRDRCPLIGPRHVGSIDDAVVTHDERIDQLGAASLPKC
jgi:hypothetical protein